MARQILRLGLLFITLGSSHLVEGETMEKLTVQMDLHQVALNAYHNGEDVFVSLDQFCELTDAEAKEVDGGLFEEWATKGAIPQAWVEADKDARPRALTAEEVEADAKFQEVIVLLEDGKKDKAIAVLKEAFVLDPQNWLIRKQLWAIDTPEAFYSGNVDYGWQKEQWAREDMELAN